jgi:hypothetical protein
MLNTPGNFMAGDTKAATSAAAAAAIDEEDEGESKSLYALIEDNALLIEALLYFVFLTLFTVYAVGANGNSNEAYTIAEHIRHIYAGFSKVSDTSSWFDYMLGPFALATYPTKYYNGDYMLTDELGFVAAQYKLLGAINMRQVRVKKDSCSVRKRMGVLVNSCEAFFSSAKEFKGEYGNIVPGTGKRQFIYSDSSEFKCSGATCGFKGPVSGVVYGGGGFVKQLPTVAENRTVIIAQTLVKQLWDSRFIDRYTSAIVVESTLH